jgi:hypothetical protein
MGGKLTALEVTRLMRARKADYVNDGAGLYLKDGSSWVFRYARGGKEARPWAWPGARHHPR